MANHVMCAMSDHLARISVQEAQEVQDVGLLSHALVLSNWYNCAYQSHGVISWQYWMLTCNIINMSKTMIKQFIVMLLDERERDGWKLICRYNDEHDVLLTNTKFNCYCFVSHLPVNHIGLKDTSKQKHLLWTAQHRLKTTNIILTYIHTYLLPSST